MAMLSRRGFMRSSASLVVGPLFAQRVSAEPAASTAIKVDLVQEIPNARLLDVSPDGTKLCLEDWKTSGYPLRVVEFGTWKTKYSGRFQQRTLAASFFADGQALFLDFAGGKGELVHRQTVVDIQSGERTERMHAYDPFRYFEQMSPIDDRTLLVAHYAVNPHRLEWLSRVEFPTYRELGRADVAGGGDSKGPGVSVSAQRNSAAYFFNNAIVCRRTEDLAVLWARPIEAGLMAFPTVSAHGDFVAASIGSSTSDGQFEHHTPLYVCIYGGKAGAEVARLPVSGKGGMALSPDGKLIAVVAEEPGKKGEILPTVRIHSVSSGNTVASVVHDHIPNGRRQFLLSGCSVVFTSDGKYLITSGMVTKVWRIGE